MENSLTEGIRQLLYGYYKPVQVVNRFGTEERDLCQKLHQIPATPTEYLRLDSELAKRWNQLKQEKWCQSYFSFPPDEPESFHILCLFYRTLIWCECRMIFQVTELWVEKLTVSILKYELVTLRGHLLEHLKECEERLSRVDDRQESLPYRLDQYMLKVLQIYLLMVFHELQQRYGHLLEEQHISKEELYLQHLQRPVPKNEGFYPTTDSTRSSLERCLRPPADPDSIRSLIESMRVRLGQSIHPKAKQELRKSLHILENVWLCAMLYKAEGEENYYDLSRPDTSLNRIHEWRQIVAGSDDDAGSDGLHLLLKQLPVIYPVLNPLPDLAERSPLAVSVVAEPSETEQEYSAAAHLIAEIETLFDPAAGAGGAGEGAGSSNGDSEIHPLLDEYISFEAIFKKFGVTERTLKKYLKESNATMTVFSNKSKWMRRDHFESFVASFQKNM